MNLPDDLDTFLTHLLCKNNIDCENLNEHQRAFIERATKLANSGSKIIFALSHPNGELQCLSAGIDRREIFHVANAFVIRTIETFNTDLEN